MPAPIALFAFNRPELLRLTLEALSANSLATKSELTIFCDGPRTDEESKLTAEVQALAHQAKGFANVQVIASPANNGLANSVIAGLKYMFTMHRRLIVMEDDLLCSPYMLEFLNEGLRRYAQEKTIFNISAWTPPGMDCALPPGYPWDVYFTPRFNCWGWASWRDRFAHIDWAVSDYAEFAGTPYLQEAFNQGGRDLTNLLTYQMQGKINSWAIRADYARFCHGKLGCNPIFSHAIHIGVDGTHFKSPGMVFKSSGTSEVILERAKALLTKARPKTAFAKFIGPDSKIIEAYMACMNEFVHPRKPVDRFNSLRSRVRQSLCQFRTNSQG